MKKMLLAGILILLLFVGTAAAVSVNYAQAQNIPQNTARDNANSALVSFIAMNKLGTSAAYWDGSSLSPTPLIIYDPSGTVYSYLFYVINKEGKVIGTVNAAGNKLVGKPIVSIEKSTLPFDSSLIITKVRELAEKSYGTAQIDYVVFIMDKNQKIAAMVILTEQNGLTHRMVYDIQTIKLSSDLITYPGLINPATTSSIFNTMSSASANRAIQNFDTNTKSIKRGIPTVRRTIPVNYLNPTNNKLTGVSTLKSIEKMDIPSGYKPTPLLKEQMTIYLANRSINLEAPISTSTTRQPISAFQLN
jgi:hypothetical protein